jgi:hypothetical protein
VTWTATRIAMSFSCPNFDMERDYCMRLHADCVPGRPGCVLARNSVFAVPPEERLRAKEEAKERSEALDRTRGDT